MILTVTLNASIDKRYVVEGASMGEVNRVKECTYTPGGKGLNVSKPASIAGAKVVATGFVGGHAGQYIVESLKPFGIEPAFYHVEGESRSCINIWDTVNHVQTEYLEPGDRPQRHHRHDDNRHAFHIRYAEPRPHRT